MAGADNRITLQTYNTRLSSIAEKALLVKSKQPVLAATDEQMYIDAAALKGDVLTEDTHSRKTLLSWGIIQYTNTAKTHYVLSPLGERLASKFNAQLGEIPSDDRAEIGVEVLCEWNFTDAGRNIHPCYILLRLLSDPDLDGYITEHEFTNFLLSANSNFDTDYDVIKAETVAFRALGASAVCPDLERSKSWILFPALVAHWNVLRVKREYDLELLPNGQYRWSMASSSSVRLKGAKVKNWQPKVIEYRLTDAAKKAFEKFQANKEPSMAKLDRCQQIFYGAPGTGKSYGVNETTEMMPKDDVVRTTFHPDSDYSTFVGAYKPKMVEVPRTMMKGEKIERISQGEADLLSEKKISYEFVPQAFAKAYVQAWKRFAEGCGAGKTMTDKIKVYAGIDAKMIETANAIIEANGGAKGVDVSTDDVAKKFAELTSGNPYKSTPQPSDYCYNRVNGSLTVLAYPKLFQCVSEGHYKCWGEGYEYNGDVMARPNGDTEDRKVGVCTNGIRTINASGILPVMLVIEEINRGDCSKVFGDLFQLLDRRVKDDENGKAGFSEYPVLADTDFADYIRTELKDVKDKIVEVGYASVVAADKLELILPANFYIWATMNTSDQSLFPMDSAFKRRWDWKYVPIKDEKKGWNIKWLGSAEEECEYGWWDFLKKINKEVLDLTKSEDKQLGYYFVKPEGDVIDETLFVNKVMFFLWNVVFKDCYTECDYFKNGDDYYTFRDFFKDDGSVDKAAIKKILDALMKKGENAAE